MVPRKEISREQIARIKLRYEARVTPIHDIAREEGVTPSQIHEMRRRFEWTSRTELGKRVLEQSIVQEKEISAALAGLAGGEAPEAASSPDDGKRQPARDPKGRFAARPQSFDVKALALRVQAALERELSVAQARIDDEAAASAESRVRTLSSLARALQTVQALTAGKRGAADDDDAAPPLDAAELRRELIRRIHHIREERGEGEG
jgi:hypothetical protein